MLDEAIKERILAEMHREWRKRNVDSVMRNAVEVLNYTVKGTEPDSHRWGQIIQHLEIALASARGVVGIDKTAESLS